MNEKPSYKELEQRVKELEKEADKFMKTQEELSIYQFMVESAHDAIFCKDLESRYIRANDKTLEAFGLSREDVIGKNDYEFMPNLEEAKKNVHDDQIVFKSGKSTEILKHMTGAKGKKYWFQAIKVPHFDNDGNVIGLVGIARDITERKQMEDALRESEAKYRTLSSNIPGMVYRASSDWSIEIISNSEIVCGYSVDEFSTKKVNWLDLIHPVDKQQVFKEGSKLTEKPMSIVQEYRILDKDGKTRWVRDHKTSFFKEDGSLIGIDGCIYDVTERNKLQAQLLQAQKMDAIGTLAGGVAHDFNNILTTIIGNAELTLMDLGKEDPKRERLEEIKKVGEKAAALTHQLLAFSRKQLIQPKVLDLNELLTGMEKMLGRIIGEDIKFKMILEPSLWRTAVDPVQMEQVIMNLAANARDAMLRGGKLIVETSNIDLDEDYFIEHGIGEAKLGSYVMLAVRDTGIGIDKEIQEHIFEPFFTTKEIGKGTGLGLSTVYGIVKQNKGFIWVYSEPELGTTFKVYMPRVSGDAGPIEKEQTPAPDLDGSETVLIVEDDDIVRKFVRNVLEHYRYKVLEAENRVEAFRVVKDSEEPIHLLITDVVMPEMGGKEIAKRVRSLYPQMKVIYMSGYTEDTIAHHGILAAGVNFIEKPFTPEKFVYKVREVLGKK